MYVFEGDSTSWTSFNITGLQDTLKRTVDVSFLFRTREAAGLIITLIVEPVDLFLRPALKLIGIFPPKYKLFAFKSQSVDDILPDTENVSMLNVNVLSFILSCVKCCSRQI
jgi:hypothetical protein